MLPNIEEIAVVALIQPQQEKQQQADSESDCQRLQQMWRQQGAARGGGL